ncbi:MAG: c-type cytochrome [Ignavibacteriales bacterium]|nr:c-type cytochrome [Ignavibacteriales bacterium]
MNIYKSKSLPIFLFLTFGIFLSTNINAQNNRDRKPTNLKVLPPDIDPHELRSIMQSFTTALGVHCDYCHDEDKGEASDIKPEKQIARVMMKMRTDINDTFLKEARTIKSDLGNINCVNCHHGSPNVTLLEDELYLTYQKSGFDTSIEKYNSLKKEYYGGAIYDFRENSLISFAAKLSNDKKFDDALKILDKNLEIFPQSTRTLNSIGNTYLTKGEKETAASYFEKALVIDPQNRFSRQMLDRIKENKL